MGISKRYFAEMSQSFASGSTSAQSGAFVSAGVTASFHQPILCQRLNLTGIYTTFVLTPSGSGRAKIIKVQANPNDSANPYSMSYGLFSVGAPGGAVLQGNAGYFTGVITGGTTQTASLNTDPAKTVIGAGSLCYLSSTNHTGNMAVEIFYKVEVV